MRERTDTGSPCQAVGVISRRSPAVSCRSTVPRARAATPPVPSTALSTRAKIEPLPPSSCTAAPNTRALKVAPLRPLSDLMVTLFAVATLPSAAKVAATTWPILSTALLRPSIWLTVMLPVDCTFRRPRGSLTLMVTLPLAEMSGSAPANSTLPATSSASAASAIGLKGSGWSSAASDSGVSSPKVTLPRSTSLPTVWMLITGADGPWAVSTATGRSARRL